MDQPTYETLLVDRTPDGVAVVTFNMPKTLNSMTEQFVHELGAALDHLGADRSVRVIVLTGSGRGFCSGHDLQEMSGSEAGADTSEDWYDGQELYADLVLRIRATPQPVVAAVNGPAAGGGLAMALASDIRICSESARFNAAFVRIGLSGCDVGVSYLLPRIVGPTLAFEMMLTGRLIDAEEAHRSGLVLEVVPDGTVVDRALEIAAGICRNAPFGVKMTKQVMWTNLDAPSLEAAIELENRTQILCVSTADFGEALAAFMEKRPPVFRGATSP